VKADALAFQKGELVGDAALVERTVGAFHVEAAGADDGGEGEHAAAADAAEKIGFGLCHRAALLARRQGVKGEGMRIGIVAPSTPIAADVVDAVNAIAERCLSRCAVGLAPAMFRSHGHFAGTDVERAERSWRSPTIRGGRALVRPRRLWFVPYR
jgi:hypothetical protein